MVTFETIREYGKLTLLLIIILSTVSGLLVLLGAEQKALDSGSRLDFKEFGDDLVRLVLIIVVLAFGGIGLKLIFGNKKRGGGW